MPEQLIDATPETSFNINNLNISVTRAKHTDPDAVGFRFKTPNLGDIAYTSDSEYFTDIGKQYNGVRLLLLCVMRPTGSPWKGHMTTDDAIKIIQEAEPEMAVLTHFGMQMIFKGPANEAKIIQQKTNVPTVAASDGMHILIDEKISVQTPRKQRGLNEFTDTWP
jgi:phosphoribosyl 1,2-cyclic phosphodiesterase